MTSCVRSALSNSAHDADNLQADSACNALRQTQTKRSIGVMEIGPLIRKARKAKGWTLEELANTVGTDTGNLSRLERGIQGASQELLQKILTALEITLGQPATAEQSNVSPAAQPVRYYRYAVISSVVAGGWGEAIQPYEPGAEDRAELTDYKAKGPAFWLEVEGDSMTSPTPPSIPEGHLILVDTGIEAQPGHLVVAKLEGDERATFKKLVSDAGQLYLKPLNPAYPIIPINGNCRIIGVVKEAKMKL
ncbi:XRE family transcriptional regulator [Metapseudomonas lalkuanensis]|nr:XRE family transcriptional regulator [Pseudomonas lalkuanensis]UCP00076.1 XRE family transcriptional regulator [Pseudomonas lalkuanensis]